MGERSLISVVVPAWRAEKTLAATLDYNNIFYAL